MSAYGNRQFLAVLGVADFPIADGVGRIGRRLLRGGVERFTVHDNQRADAAVLPAPIQLHGRQGEQLRLS